MLAFGRELLEAFTVVTSVASIMGIFTWSMILVSYLVYRKKFPKRHEASKYKMPFGRTISWVGLVFFALMIYALSLQPETGLALALSPIWFIGVELGYEIMVRRHARKRLLAESARVESE